MLSAIWAFVRLGRPHFLAGGFLLHALGACMAWFSGAPINLTVYAWTQVAITATQLMTHYSNDYFDLAADRANRTPTAWSGGSRVLPAAGLAPRIALRASLVLMGVAFCTDLWLAFGLQTGPLTLAILLPALALAWFYSAPPIRLHSRGWGELSAALVVTCLTPLAGYYTQAGHLSALPFLAVVPLACLQFAMLMAINFPDAAGDTLAGKRTLVVRLGARSGAMLRVLALALAYLSLPVLIVLGLPSLPALALLLAAPLALWQLWRTGQGDWSHPAGWNMLAFLSIVHLMAAISLELGAFILLLALKIRL